MCPIHSDKMQSLKVPTAIQKAREALQKAGLPITAENLQQTLSRDEYNKAQGCLRYALKASKEPGAEAALVKYQDKQLTDNMKSQWLAKFVLDPNCARCFAEESHEKISVNGSRGKKVWLTLAQMAGPKYWNSQDDAKLIAQDSESRPHTSPSMAAAGRKEFHVELTEEIWERVNADKVKIRAEANMDPAHFAQMRKEIGSEHKAPARKKSRSVLALENGSPEEKAQSKQVQDLKKLITSFNVSNGILKRQADKHKKVSQQAIADAQTLLEKGYPQVMVDFYVAMFTELKDLCGKSLDKWAANACWISEANAMTDIAAKKTEADEEVKALDDAADKLGSKIKDVSAIAKGSGSSSASAAK